MKTLSTISKIVIITLGLALSCSKDFLDVKPKGALSATQMSDQKGVETLLVGAYSMLDQAAENVPVVGANGFTSNGASNWVFGGITGGDAHKGTDEGDQPDINPIERYEASSVNAYFNVKWGVIYEGVSRCNSVLATLAVAKGIAPADVTRIQAEARGLRGHFHFEAKKLWGNIPYIDETAADPGKVSNTADAWPGIEADLNFAATNLPVAMSQVGRLNSYVAKAMLAKAYMYQGKYAQAKTLLLDILNNGKNPLGVKFALNPTYHANFFIPSKNSSESVFSVQSSVNDGGGPFNGNTGDVLNFPYLSGTSPAGCCGFYQPSFEFVNSFITQAGLPLLDGSYISAAKQFKSDLNVESCDAWKATTAYKKDDFTSVTVADRESVYKAKADNTGAAPAASPTSWDLVFVESTNASYVPLELDPRLDWSVGRRGVPYLDWGNHTGKNWTRKQQYGGPYSPIKNTYYKSQSGSLTDKSSWTEGWTAQNVNVIRLADVILWLAEIEVETGSLDQARIYVNLIRARAQNSAGFVMDPGGAPAANYVINQYLPAVPPFDTQPNARAAVHFERKLELGMEGHRFFDLVRWNEAQATINAYLAYERTILPQLTGASFGTEDKTYPIPQRQIDLSGSAVLIQNSGH